MQFKLPKHYGQLLGPLILKFTSFLWQLVQQSISDRFAHFVTWKPKFFFFFFITVNKRINVNLCEAQIKSPGSVTDLLYCHQLFSVFLSKDKNVYNLRLWCTEREDEKRTQHLFLHHEHPCVWQWPLFELHLGLPPAHLCHLRQSERMGWPVQIEKHGNFVVACVASGMVNTCNVLAEELQSCVDNGEEILWNRFSHLLPNAMLLKPPHTSNI